MNPEDYPHVTAILKGAGLIELGPWNTDLARDRGTALHLTTQFMDEGGEFAPSDDAIVAARAAGYARFVAEVKPTILSIEEPVWNHEYRYQGRLDRRVVIDGNEGVLDIKPATQADWHPLQAIAYARCFSGLALKRWNLYLNNEGDYKLIERTGRHDWQVFLAALTIHNWRVGNGTDRTHTRTP